MGFSNPRPPLLVALGKGRSREVVLASSGSSRQRGVVFIKSPASSQAPRIVQATRLF